MNCVFNFDILELIKVTELMFKWIRSVITNDTVGIIRG